MRHESPIKKVPCQTCGAAVGAMCGRERFGAPSQWERTSYHTQRVRDYNAALRDGVFDSSRPQLGSTT
jgi:hypothetical protein